jgi:SET domain
MHIGGELFKFYGDNWFETRPDMFEKLPLSKDYPRAERLIRKFLKSCPKTVQQDAYKLIVETINSGSLESRTLNALPKDFDQALVAAQNDLGTLLQPSATRSIEWLEENGRCIDHIAPGPSTLPQASRGAFAVRNLKQGQIITTSPLHHVPHRDIFNMYNLTEWRNEDGKLRILRHVDQIIGRQLVLNYCYGHPDSTMLVFPYGAGINYINHNQTLANVQVRWAVNFSISHNEQALRQRKPEDYEGDYSPKLAFDYVATRDIAKGEELFLDYGDDWEAAWQAHVSQYTPHGTRSESYASGRYWNEHFGDSILRTEDEQKIDPYPDHLQLRCHEKLNSRIAPASVEWLIKDYGYPCRILDRFYENGEHFYTVMVELEHDYKSGRNGNNPKVMWVQRTDVPRSAINFFDKPFTSDLHLPNTFRHPIGIPEEMIPPQWFNDVQETDEDEDEEYEYVDAEGEEDEDDDDEDEDEYDEDEYDMDASEDGENITRPVVAGMEPLKVMGQNVPTPPP